MRRLVLAAVIVLGIGGIVLAGAAKQPTYAQTSTDLIRAAYDTYQGWDTYQVQVRETSDYALTAEGKGTSLWQRQERDITLAGWYDQTNPDQSMISLNISGDSATSTDNNGTSTPVSWSIDLNAAQVAGQTFWRGNYTSDPTQDFALPQDWQTFGSRDVSPVPMLVDLALNRYLRQENNDPFVGDYNAWLDAAQTVVGPTQVYVNRRTQGDLYEIELPLRDAPDSLPPRLLALVDRVGVVTDDDALLQALYDNGTLTWNVALDPSTGALLAQQLSLDISANLYSGLADSYASLSLEFSDERNILFSGVGEPVDTSGLPEAQ